MSEASRAARAAMKSKAERLVRTDPKGTVDASGYTPPDALDADVKTGMRPISPRAFRKGGKVKGAEAHHHAGRKPRKAGGRALTPDSMINRNAKEANEERAGEKHVGALKRGGAAKRKHRLDGGETINDLLDRNPGPSEAPADSVPRAPRSAPENQPITPAMAAKMKAAAAAAIAASRRKDGGRTHKSDGGPLSGSFYGNVLRPNKQAKGGKVEHDDEAMDKALIKKMVKANARTGKAEGGELPTRSYPNRMTNDELISMKRAENEADQEMGYPGASTSFSGGAKLAEEKYDRDMAFKKANGMIDLKRGGRTGKAGGGMAAKISGTRPTGGRTAKAKGGEMPRPTPEQEEQIRQEQLRGARVILGKDRTARAAGGRTKGKTNVNIIIGQHPPGATGGGGMPMPPAPKPSMPVPMPPPPGPMQGPPGAPGAPGAPMPIPVPMGPQGGGMPPMGRARGGRTYPIHDGAGGGEGRLEKIAAYGLKPPKKG